MVDTLPCVTEWKGAEDGRRLLTIMRPGKNRGIHHLLRSASIFVCSVHFNFKLLDKYSMSLNYKGVCGRGELYMQEECDWDSCPNSSW